MAYVWLYCMYEFAYIFILFSFFSFTISFFSFCIFIRFVVSICRSLNIIRRWIKLYTPHLIHNCTYTLILRFDCWRSDSDSDCDALYLCFLFHCSTVNDTNDSICSLCCLCTFVQLYAFAWRLDTLCGSVLSVLCIWHTFGTIHLFLNNIL